MAVYVHAVISCVMKGTTGMDASAASAGKLATKGMTGTSANAVYAESAVMMRSMIGMAACADVAGNGATKAMRARTVAVQSAARTFPLNARAVRRS